jgi:hypothetical protein
MTLLLKDRLSAGSIKCMSSWGETTRDERAFEFVQAVFCNDQLLKNTVCLISSVGLDFSTTFTQEFWPPETIYWRIAESAVIIKIYEPDAAIPQ